MSDADLFARNRVILCHFDSYSTALVFARWPDKSLLLGGPLPDGTKPLEAAPATVEAIHDSATVRDAAIARCGLVAKELTYVDEFSEWFDSPQGTVRVHLIRFTTFDAPKPLIEAQDGNFKSIVELRGSAMVELGMLRKVFNLIITGGGRADANGR